MFLFTIISFLVMHRPIITIMLMVTAFALCVWFVNPFSNEPKEDSRQYHMLATNLANIGVLSLETDPPFVPSGRRVPGYPMFLAAIYSVVGTNVQAAKFVQIIMTPFLVWMAFSISRSVLASEKLAIVAAATIAVTPALVGMTNHLMPEALFTMCLLACVLTTVKWSQSSHVRWAIATGVLCGFMGLTKPEAAALVVAMVFAVVVTATNKSRMGKQAIITLIATAVVISPWICRNHAVFGKASLITGSKDGSGPGMLRYYRLRAEHDVTFRPERFKYLYGKDRKAAQIRYEEAVAENVVKDPEVSDMKFWLQRPSLFMKYCGIRAIGLFKPVSWSNTFGLEGDFSGYRKNGQYLQLVAKGFLLIFDAMLILLGVLGFLFSLRWRNRHLWIISATVAYFFAIYILLHGIARYRVPILPLMTILAVWFVSNCVVTIRNHLKQTSTPKHDLPLAATNVL